MRRVALAVALAFAVHAGADTITIVATGTNPTGAVTSPDGAIWTPVPSFPALSFHTVRWNGAYFLALGSNSAATAPDGLSWTARSIITGNWSSAAWNGSTWCATSAATTTAGLIASSPDAVTWTSQGTGQPNATYGNIIWNGSVFAATGIAGSLFLAATSPDCVTWTTRTISSTVPPPALWSVGAWNGSVFLGFGSLHSGSAISATSPDGLTWTTHTLLRATAGPPVWNGTIFCAVDATSRDGADWTFTPTPPGTFFDMAWTGSSFVAVGPSTASTSPDCATWTPRTIPSENYQGIAVSIVPAPLVSSVTPTAGLAAGGTSTTITGSGFRTGATVSFGGTAASTVNVVSSTEITAATPAHTPGQVDVVVTNIDAQLGTLYGAFAYYASNAPAPAIAGVSPSHGPLAGGETITVAGSGFQQGAALSLGGTAATAVTVTSASSLTAIAPAHAAGAVTVAISNPDSQSGSLDAAFTYDAGAAAAPTLTAISNPGGVTTGGYTLTLTGTGFQNGATVTFGGTPATSVVVVSASEITLVAPAHDPGAVDVVVTNPDSLGAILSAGFTYVVPHSGCGYDAGTGALALLALALMASRLRAPAR